MGGSYIGMPMTGIKGKGRGRGGGKGRGRQWSYIGMPMTLPSLPPLHCFTFQYHSPQNIYASFRLSHHPSIKKCSPSMWTVCTQNRRVDQKQTNGSAQTNSSQGQLWKPYRVQAFMAVHMGEPLFMAVHMGVIGKATGQYQELH